MSASKGWRGSCSAPSRSPPRRSRDSRQGHAGCSTPRSCSPRVATPPIGSRSRCSPTSPRWRPPSSSARLTETITLDDLLGIHRTLMERSATPGIGGVVRTVQNWIGGSSYNPCSAAFVPPPPDTLDALLDDLLTYVNRRRSSCPRAGSDRPRPVRDHPPVRRRQRPHRARAHPCHPPPPWPRTALRAAHQSRARHLGQRLHRRPHRVPTRRGAGQSRPIRRARAPGCARSPPPHTDHVRTPSPTRARSKRSMHDGENTSVASAPTRRSSCSSTSCPGSR